MRSSLRRRITALFAQLERHELAVQRPIVGAYCRRAVCRQLVDIEKYFANFFIVL